MRVLFVCRYNVGRSQFAAAYWNWKTGVPSAKSSGTDVDRPGQLLSSYAKLHLGRYFTLQVAKRLYGLTLDRACRSQIQLKDLRNYDLIISMARLEDSPYWLLASSKYLHLDTADPGGRSFAVTADAFAEIRSQIDTMLTTLT